jgi:pimeloyl-ACP methyl ester carboxylesterase
VTGTVLIGGRKVQVAEAGRGDPLLYLHGFADIHGASADWLPFHHAAAQFCRLLAPAHPGCGDSDEDELIDRLEDVVFHYLEVLDALALDRFFLAGSSIGGWIAAELAIRIPERVRGVLLFGATGLWLPEHPIGDLFMMVQPENVSSFAGFRRMLFRSAEAPEALAMFPDGVLPVAREILRYKMFRLASRIAFAPPYFYHPRLRERLSRYHGPAVAVAGEADAFVPPVHAEAYAQGFAQGRSHLVSGAGNSIIVEQPERAATLVKQLLSRHHALAEHTATTTERTGGTRA